MNHDTIPSLERDAAITARLERLAARRATQTPTNSHFPAHVRAGDAAAITRKRRPHPSKKSRVAALSLSLATTGGLTYAFASTGSSVGTDAVATLGVVTPDATAASTRTAAPIPTTSATGAAAAPTTTASTRNTAAPTTTAATGTVAAASKTVNGAVVTNRYGAVQVQVLFTADGRISAVNLLQLPTDRKSVNINNRAVPALNSEALSTQSAHVHTISGATYTSVDYAKSLQSAIDNARASGITQLT